MKEVISNWFAAHINKCFQTGLYKDEKRLYSNFTQGLDYIVIKCISYDVIANTLVVYTDDKMFELVGEPDLRWFEDTLKTAWKKWDMLRGEAMNKNRWDYQPIPYKSRKALAESKNFISNVEYCWFAVYINKEIRLYHPNGSYILIQGVEYNVDKNILIVESSGNNKHCIYTEPNLDLFEIIIGGNKSQYQVFSSIKELAAFISVLI